MPQLGETVTEGTITKWLKAVGDTVARDEPLFEVSTDKVDSEVPSPAAGVLTSILVEEGDTVDVGVTLAVIGGDGSVAGGDAGSGTAPAEAGSAPMPAEPRLDSVAPAAQASAQPAAQPSAPAPRPPVTAPTADGASATGAGLVLSPVVRRLLNEHGIDPSAVTGTGLGGRITRGDVESLIAAGGPSGPAAAMEPSPVPSIAGRDGSSSTGGVPAPARTAPRADRAGEQAHGTGTPVRDEVVPFTNIRRRTAEHMTRSKATSAHTLMVKEIDYERVELVRRAHGDRFKAEEGFGLTYLPFAALATVEALAEYPHLNASVGEDALIVHHGINLGIAVDLDNEGLIVPVVHNAEELNLRGMARRIRDVADRARTKRLSLDDISGGTFSITNAGPFGTLITGAIINQPQVAILSTDGVSRKPVVVDMPDGGEAIAIHSVGLVAMNFDHRAVDGAYVARFLARLAQILDERDWAGEL
jgi:pyruvate dehydrogenase E2 component (dihydrolipoamide acetyltransferase)